MNDTFILDEELNDQEFDNFFKGKKRKSCESEAMSRGKNKRQAKIECKTKMGGGAVGRTAKKVYLAIPRGAFLTLLRLNYRGFASRLSRAKNEDPTEWQRGVRKWVSLGGNESSLVKGMEAGKNKRALACGKKCKDKFDITSNFIDYTDDEMIFFEDNPDYQFSNVVDPVTISTLIATGGTVLGVMASAISKTKMNKQEAEADAESKKTEAEFYSKQEEEKSKRTKTLIVGGSILAVILLVGAVVLVKKRRNK